MGCFLKRRVVGCYGVPIVPSFLFNHPRATLREDKGLSIHTTIDLTPLPRKHSVLCFLYTSHLKQFGPWTLLWFVAFLYIALASASDVGCFLLLPRRVPPFLFVTCFLLSV